MKQIITKIQSTIEIYWKTFIDVSYVQIYPSDRNAWVTFILFDWSEN